MTRDEALLEVRKALGEAAKVFDRVEDPDTLYPKGSWDESIRRVGRYWVGDTLGVYGNGNTWEDAIAAAKEMKIRDDARRRMR